jgi:4-hydroxy-L-threonine phosphate dehydrogenase PdxA
MFHDQGHVAVKTLGFAMDPATGRMTALSGVNVTLGLPIVRTSPDHGTAYDIAGRGIADPSATIKAFETLVALAAMRLSRAAA